MSKAYFSNPPYIFAAILLIETQVLIQAKTNIIPVKAVSSQTLVQEVLFEGGRDGRFPAGGEASEPESASLLAPEGAALGVRQRGMPCYISPGWSVEYDRRGRGR